jgi:ATP sulfurylase
LSEIGVDIFRFNLSHISEKDFVPFLKCVRSCSDVPVCIDTEGAQVRTGQMDGRVTVKEHDRITIRSGSGVGNSRSMCITPDNVLPNLDVGDLISVDFDTALLRVMRKKSDSVIASVLYDGYILSNKGVRIVNRTLPLPPLTAKDISVIRAGIKLGVRHVALSFANSGKDVKQLRGLCPNEVFVISKIESRCGLDNLDDILDLSDAVLIDRGDLSKEESIVSIPFLQKHIIEKAKKKDRPVYVATNLLESMVDHRSPTRAEVNDVINTLLDGADGLVLAAETAIGDHPIGSVSMIRSLIRQYESLGRNAATAGRSNSSPSYLLAPPHGDILVDREKIMDTADIRRLKFKRVVRVDEETIIDAEQIACGAYSPLEGFMGAKTLESVLAECALPSGEVWTMPILWQVPEKEWRSISVGDSVGIGFGRRNEVHAAIEVSDVFTIDMQKTLTRWFGTCDPEHAGVRRVLSLGRHCLGGRITLLKKRRYPCSEHALTPKETRTVFEHKGWTKIIAFHTRNVVHRAHEHIQLKAFQDSYADGLFIHPLIGPRKPGDFSAQALVRGYELMCKKYYLKGKVFFSVFPAYPRYAGPREAVFTALCRKNYGATHFIVGRDHSGVGNYYAPLAAKEFFLEMGEIGIKPIFFNKVLYCRECRGYVERCGHGTSALQDISGSKVRHMLLEGKKPPAYLLRPEISSMLIDMIKNDERVFF